MKSQKVYFLMGLPASGKSTLARELVKEGKGKVKRLNKDDLRAMIDDGVWSKENEETILSIQRQMLKSLLKKGYSVVVDDTNYNPYHLRKVYEIAEPYAEVIVKELDTPIDVCIERDLQRVNGHVGEKVIRRIDRQRQHYKRHIAEGGRRTNDYAYPGHDENLPPAIVVDLDGTLAHANSRNIFDYSRVDTDDCDEAVKKVVNIFWRTHPVIIMSGREGTEECLDKTKKWLQKHGVRYDRIYMRAEGDHRPDYIVKREMFVDHVAGEYNVLFVLDDRNSVVDEWRSMGLKVLQVEEGDF